MAEKDRLLEDLRSLIASEKERPAPRAFRSRRNLFPLPSECREELNLFPFELGLGSVLKDSVLIEKAAESCWCELVRVFVNRLSGCKDCVGSLPPSAPQRDLLNSLRASVKRLLCEDVELDWGLDQVVDDFSKRTLSYTGEEVCKAEALSLERILPALPPEGHGGAIKVVDWVGVRTRWLLENPQACICPDVGQELPRLQGKVHIPQSEQLPVARELVRRGICTWTEDSEVLRYRGQEVLSGLFGVPKSKLLPDGRSVLRLIMNLTPINAVLKVIEGRVARLPSITQWLSVVVGDDEEVRISQSDMACAFYLFKLPSQWSRLLTFNVGFSGSELGFLDSEHRSKRWFLSCQVLPMGWSSAVGVMQEAAETILLRGGLDAGGQLSKTSPLPPWLVNCDPGEANQGRPWWHVYLDNFAGGAKVKGTEADALVDLQHAAEEEWDKAGIVISKGKSVSAASSGVELGAFIGGKGQWIGAGPDRMLKIAKGSLWLAGQSHVSRKKLQIVMGRWCFALQFRRPAMSHFDKVWSWISGKSVYAGAGREVKLELILAVMGIPLFHTWLGARVDESITCSDASMRGGAVAVSRTLSSAGKSFVESQTRHNAPLAVPVVVISLFNGIGGAARCYDICGVEVKAYIACDIHKPSNRVCARRWPNMIFWEDVKTLSKSVLAELLAGVGDFEELHGWAGFPCVDLSSVRANRRNLQGEASGLIFEALRVFRECVELFPEARFEYFYENVSSMDPEARDQISALVGVLPYKLDPSCQVPNSRPRFCWTSISLERAPGLVLTSHEGYTLVQVDGTWPRSTQWMTEGWEQADDSVIYPTFMKAIPRGRPPVRPAGLERTDRATRARWEDDAFRFPPYQYKYKYLLFSLQDGTGRLLNSDEREILMGYGPGHTKLCMSASDIKGREQAYEDERCSLVGDSFSIWSFCLVAAAGVAKFVGWLDPQLLFQRMGLPPGLGLRSDLICPLQTGFEIPTLLGSADVQQMNQHLLARVRHTGSDSRITSGQILNPKAFPRQSAQALWWEWEQVFRTRWAQAEQINALEIRAIYLSLLWKTLQRSVCNRRIFHLSDSYVSISILSKGRTASRKLHFIVNKINALLLAAHCILNLVHVDSSDNPTDEASRA